MKKRPNEKIGKPVRPNIGIEVAYRKQLRSLVDEMAVSYEHWLSMRYRQHPPALAQDATVDELKAELRTLGKRWRKRFDDAAPKLAKWFLQKVNRRSDRVLQRILKDAGYTVKFKTTPAMKDAIDGALAENVGLIRSIGQQYHSQVETLVMRSVASGRDLAPLVRDLKKRFKITRARAELIALDQNNKATSEMMRARQTSVGIEEGIWLHSHAGKKPRPTHFANHGNRFNLAAGWFDPDPRVREHILPGQLINCRCTWRPVVKGFT